MTLLHTRRSPFLIKLTPRPGKYFWDRLSLRINGNPRGERYGWGTQGTVCKRQNSQMSPEGFEPPTFGSGIRRAAVAPWVRDSAESALWLG